MKTRTLLAMLFITTISLNAQIEDLSNASADRKITAKEYDFSFIKPDYSTTKEIKAGLIGQEITIYNLSSYIYLKNVDGSSSSYSDLDKVNNKTFKIIDYVDDDFKIKNEESEWRIGSNSDGWFIKSYIDKIKEKYLNKNYISFIYNTEISGIDEQLFKLDGKNSLKIINVVFAKISTFDYGIVFKFDNNLMAKYNSESYSQPKKDGWLNLESNYISTLFVEKEVLEAYTKKNTPFINLMRNKKVKIGMNEEQCRMAWGIPTSSMSNIAGYEKVLVYGSIGNSNNLYFKNNILKLIK